MSKEKTVMCHCSHCGAEIQYIIPAEPEEEEGQA